MTKPAEIQQSRIAVLGDEIRDVVARISAGSARPADVIKLDTLISERVKIRTDSGLRAAKERAREQMAARRARFAKVSAAAGD